MVATQKPLLSLRASDLMSRTVIAVPREMSLCGAARLLSRAQVTGAPVVDGAGVCIGVISATDFLNWAERDRPTGPNKERGCVCASWQIVEPDKLPEDQVENYMTRDPVTAKASTSIVELARMMINVHIHRVVVVDDSGRPVGVVSSTDVLAAVAGAA